MDYGLGAAKYQLQIKYATSSTETARSRTFGGINAPASGVDTAFVTLLVAFFNRAYEQAPGTITYTNFVESRAIQPA